MRPLLSFCLVLYSLSPVNAQEATEPVRALLIAGGCCHEYAQQQDALRSGIQSQANIRVDVYWTDNSTTAPILPIYRQLNWADEYDIIIHDECAADIKDAALVDRIVQVHQKIPAVHLHCAMHSFRTGSDAWFKHLGLQSSGHGPQEPIAIEFVDVEHPITKTLQNWTTIREELYNNVKVFGAHPLAIGRQKIGGANPREDEAIVVWTNEIAGVRSFSTTIGHNTETVQDPRYIELVTRGILWACDKLAPEYLTAYTGESTTTFIDKDKFKAVEANALGVMPEGATLVKVTASSTQNGHPTSDAIDGNKQTRWCADGPSYPQWLQLEFDAPIVAQEVLIDWESKNAAYQYRIEGSTDGVAWFTLVDQSENTLLGQSEIVVAEPKTAKFIRLLGLGSTAGWCSLWEFTVKSDGVHNLWPADASIKDGPFMPLQGDLYASMGNVPPRIEPLTPEKEAEILRDVTVAEGFEATVFAAPPAVNYPVFVAADVGGTVYVSSDGNGSLGRNPMRGRVIRLRDLDGDGRADETKVFCEVDAPRGLVWDHDRLYLMHPPHLSAFIDHDRDGIADEQKVLVKNLAFGYDQRPADHTTNGLSMGVDGWLYIAGGDFGFLDAEGADGRHVTHRGGGVIRVRPDGTGLEVYSTGTRNILEVAISPTMDMYARDNTNDGGGWDVRLHHFTGMEDHGYPRLYKNFDDECVQPLADYGGGSGCGAVFIDEPGFGRWNNAPFTADWGTGSLYRHTVVPNGASYKESAAPESFVKMTRPTDADVDGNSKVYCASWRGATFDWEGENVGYLICVRPKGLVPTPMPDFVTASDMQLAELLRDPSYRRRLAAQRELVRRSHPGASKLLDIARASRSESRNLLEHLQSDATNEECIAALKHPDELVVHTAIRVLAQRGAYRECIDAFQKDSTSAEQVSRALAMMHQKEVVDFFIECTNANNGAVQREVLGALCRLYYREGKWNGDSWGTRPDTRGPYYQPEPWDETARIDVVLQQQLAKLPVEEITWLMETMSRNRIQSDRSLAVLISKAMEDNTLAGPALQQLVERKDGSSNGRLLVQQLLKFGGLTPEQLANIVVLLSRYDDGDAPAELINALEKLDHIEKSESEKARALLSISQSDTIQNQVALYSSFAQAREQQSYWPEVLLLLIAESSRSSVEAKIIAKGSIAEGWKDVRRQRNILLAAIAAGTHGLDDQIINLASDPRSENAKLASRAMDSLKIVLSEDDSPKISTLEPSTVLKQVLEAEGNRELGRAVFTKATCVACHTVQQNEVQKGPYLGNIAKTYKRPDLAVAILEPSKTIAQGFVTNILLTDDGEVITGFITSEESDRVAIRDQQGKERTVMKEDIDDRKTSNISVMPAGLINDLTVREFASLLDYLQSLSISE